MKKLNRGHTIKNHSENRLWIILLLSVFFVLAIFFSFSNSLVYLIILSLASLLIIFFLRPVIGLYLVSLLLPIVGLPFYFKSLELPLIDLLSLIALSAFFLRHLYIYFFAPRINKEKIIFPLGEFFLIFFVALFLSALASSSFTGAMWHFLRWILFFYLAFVVFPFNVVKNTKQLKKVILAISFSGLVLALVGLSSLFLQDISDAFFRAKPLKIFNQWIFGENYNLMAEFLIISSFFLLSLKYFFKKTRVSRLINVIFIFFVLIVFLTFGRTAWITITLQLLLYFSIEALWFKNKKISLLNSFIYLFIVCILLSPLFIKMTDLQRANISSTQNRLLLTQVSWSAFLDKPLLGHGGGSFVSLVDKETRFVAKYGDPLDSHGFVQKVIAENGFLGILSFLLLLFMIFRKSLLSIISKDNIIQSKRHYKLLLPLFIGAFGGFFYQFFNTSYYKGRVWLPIAVLLLAINIVLKDNPTKKRVEKSNSKNI